MLKCTRSSGRVDRPLTTSGRNMFFGESKTGNAFTDGTTKALPDRRPGNDGICCAVKIRSTGIRGRQTCNAGC